MQRPGTTTNPLVRSAALLLLGVGLLGSPPVAAQQAADWTVITAGSPGSGAGFLDGVAVSMAGGQVLGGETNGTSPAFNNSVFTPQLAAGDELSLIADPASSYTFTFSAPIQNPTFHFRSLASTVTFQGGETLVKVTGESTFVVSGSTVTGAVDDTKSPNDANGTVRVLGSHSSISLTVTKLPSLILPDGLSAQLLGNAAPNVPISGPLGIVAVLLGLVAVGSARLRKP